MAVNFEKNFGTRCIKIREVEQLAATIWKYNAEFPECSHFRAREHAPRGGCNHWSVAFGLSEPRLGPYRAEANVWPVGLFVFPN